MLDEKGKREREKRRKRGNGTGCTLDGVERSGVELGRRIDIIPPLLSPLLPHIPHFSLDLN